MEVDNTQDCEFTGSGTQGRLSRGATTVTLYAGLFRSSSGGAVSARLVGLRADGSVAATGSAVVLNAVHFNVPVTVTSAAGDIAAFRLSAEGPGAIGSAVGFDDLTFEFPDTSSPDITLTMGSGTLEILQGRTLDVPITTLRIDGSDGPLALSVSGLPTFVTAQILPNPLPGTEQGAVLRLTASIAAPPTTAQLTVTADPQGNSAVAPGPRTVTRSLRVSSNFEIEAGTTGEMFLPPCAPVEYPLRITRAETFKDVITLTADNVPAGVTATFLPDDTLGPEGPFLYLPRLVLSRQAGGSAANGFVRVGATSGSISRYLYVPIEPQSPQASVAGNAIGWGPMKEHKGWEVTLEGNGFCPGTAIEMTDSVPAERRMHRRSRRTQHDLPGRPPRRGWSRHRGAPNGRRLLGVRHHEPPRRQDVPQPSGLPVRQLQVGRAQLGASSRSSSVRTTPTSPSTPVSPLAAAP